MSRVVDVRDLLEDELLDLGLRDRSKTYCERGSSSRESPARIGVPSSGSASRTTFSSSECAITSARDAVLEDLLEHHDLAVALELAGSDDVHRLVEHDLLAGAQLRGSTSGLTTTRILRPEVNTSTEPSSKSSRKTP